MSGDNVEPIRAHKSSSWSLTLACHTMAARELVLGPSNGVVTTLALTGASLTVRSCPPSAANRSFLFASCARHSHSEIPLHNFIAATVSGTTVNVSYLARTSGERLHMNHIRGNVAEKDVPLATEWCNSITQVAYQGTRITHLLPCLSSSLLSRPRRESFQGLEGAH